MFSLEKLFSSHVILLILIVFLGFILRTYRLSEIPVGFHIDEAQVGYNAYSILKTGRDETGRFLSSHLKIWNFERPLGITYLSIPAIWIFGLSEFATRFDTAILGSLTIVLVFLLTQKVFQYKGFSLLATLLFAISPWHIILSRATSDAVVSLFFFVLGTLFAWQALKKDSFLFLIFSYLGFVASFFSYFSTRITIPFLLIFFLLLATKERKRTAIGFLLLFIVYLAFPFFVFWRASTSRFNQVSLFQEQGTKLLLEEQIREDGSNYPIILTRLFHNKVLNFTLKISQNIAAYFSYDFLVLKGGLPIRYLVPNMGVLYFGEFPFFLWGIIYLFSRPAKKIIIIKNQYFILLWIFLGTLSASITLEDTPNLQRALFILPGFQWLVSLGILDCWERLSTLRLKSAFITLVIILASWNLSYFLHQYSVHTLKNRPWYRFYEMKELIAYLNSAKRKNKNIYLTFNSTEPYIYFLFYNQTNPSAYQKLIKEKGLEYVWNNIDNIKIIRRDCPIIGPQEREGILAIFKVNCKFPKGSHIVKTFAFSDGAVSQIAVDFPKGFSTIYGDLKYEEPTIE